MFLKNRNIISKIEISKVTDYAALIIVMKQKWHIANSCPELEKTNQLGISVSSQRQSSVTNPLMEVLDQGHQYEFEA